MSWQFWHLICSLSRKFLATREITLNSVDVQFSAGQFACSFSDAVSTHLLQKEVRQLEHSNGTDLRKPLQKKHVVTLLIPGVMISAFAMFSTLMAYSLAGITCEHVWLPISSFLGSSCLQKWQGRTVSSQWSCKCTCMLTVSFLRLLLH